MMYDIDKVNWSSLGYPQIPDLYQQLTSNEAKIQVDAFHRIEAEVILGGYDWESFDLGKGIKFVIRNDAQIILVPFLLKLLQPEVNSIKTDIMYLLSRLLQYRLLFDPDDIYKEYISKLRHSIWQGRFHYVELLSDSSLETRRSALSLMMEFKEAKYIVEAYDLVVSKFHPPLTSNFE